MKKLIVAISALLLTITAFAAEKPSAPAFSVIGGVYDSAFYLTLSGQGGDIYYTTDGSIPTTASQRYTEPIAVTAKTTEMQNWGYAEPTVIPAGTVIRAAIISYGQSSEVVTNTYFVGTELQSYFGGLPIANITVAPYDLWDEKNGIYTNYAYEHKVPASFQYCNTAGVCDINRTVEVKVSGHGSRYNPKKSFRVYFKKTDPLQGKYLEYPLIPDNLDRSGKQITTYSKVTFRISDWQNTDLRDAMAQKLADGTRVDTAASTPMSLFLNGEYWGMYECREQYDDDYIASHYGLNNDDVVFFDRDWTLACQYESLSDTGKIYVDKLEYSSGPEDGSDDGRLGESYYRDLWRYIQSLVLDRDITDPAVYAEFCANVDVDNLIDYMMIYIFSSNDDWPGNNFKFWRVTEENIDPEMYGADGKWRFMVHDFDIAFESVWHNTLELSAFGAEPDTETRHPQFATRFLAGLLKNSDFRNQFAQRTMAALSSRLSESNVRAIADDLTAQHKPGKTADLLRWGWGPEGNRVNSWLWAMDGYARFAAERKNILIDQYTNILNGKFNAGITGQARLMLTNAAGGGTVNYQISGENMGGGGNKIISVFAGIPVTVTAGAVDGDVLITVSHRGDTVSGLNELTLIPQANEPYTVSAVVVPSAVEVSASLPIGFGRAERFSAMTAGEKLPASVFDSAGNRIEAQFTITGGCAVLNGNIVQALFPGAAVLAADCGDTTLYTNITVK